MSEHTYTINRYISFNNDSFNILRSDGAIIPSDDANSDYQQYLIDTDGGLPVSDES